MQMIRTRKPRYAVCDTAGAIMLETESRLRAWWTWLMNRKAGAFAYDRRGWIEDPKSWLRCGSPN